MLDAALASFVEASRRCLAWTTEQDSHEDSRASRSLLLVMFDAVDYRDRLTVRSKKLVWQQMVESVASLDMASGSGVADRKEHYNPPS